jgi:serine/threonine protein kinase
MGVVYKAEDLKTSRFVALKFLAWDLLSDKDARRRFEQEAHLTARLNHPNICAVHDLGDSNGWPFMAMPYLEGRDLAARARIVRFDAPQVADIGRQVAAGLSAIHRCGIVHRDIKPSNIFLTNRGCAVILDFGVAQCGNEQSKVEHGTFAGTRAYMSPEQTSAEPTDHRTDLWSLGVVLYELLTGHPPFRGERAEAVSYAILNEEPEPCRPKGRCCATTRRLEKALDRALTKEASDRYPSADAFARKLAQVMRLEQHPNRHLWGPTALNPASHSCAEGVSRNPILTPLTMHA